MAFNQQEDFPGTTWSGSLFTYVSSSINVHQKCFFLSHYVYTHCW